MFESMREGSRQVKISQALEMRSGYRKVQSFETQSNALDDIEFWRITTRSKRAMQKGIFFKNL